jgi:hypothetical protein
MRVLDNTNAMWVSGTRRGWVIRSRPCTHKVPSHAAQPRTRAQPTPTVALQNEHGRVLLLAHRFVDLWLTGRRSSRRATVHPTTTTTTATPLCNLRPTCHPTDPRCWGLASPTRPRPRSGWVHAHGSRPRACCCLPGLRAPTARPRTHPPATTAATSTTTTTTTTSRGAHPRPPWWRPWGGGLTPGLGARVPHNIKQGQGGGTRSTVAAHVRGATATARGAGGVGGRKELRGTGTGHGPQGTWAHTPRGPIPHTCTHAHKHANTLMQTNTVYAHAEHTHGGGQAWHRGRHVARMPTWSHMIPHHNVLSKGSRTQDQRTQQRTVLPRGCGVPEGHIAVGLKPG